MYVILRNSRNNNNNNNKKMRVVKSKSQWWWCSRRVREREPRRRLWGVGTNQATARTIDQLFPSFLFQCVALNCASLSLSRLRVAMVRTTTEPVVGGREQKLLPPRSSSYNLPPPSEARETWRGYRRGNIGSRIPHRLLLHTHPWEIFL